MKYAPGGRANCSKCHRWRHLIDFSVHTWADPAKTVPKRLQSWCHACRNEYNRRHRTELSDAQRAKIRATGRVHQRRLRRQAGVEERAGGAYVKTRDRAGNVPRWPFSRWLREKVKLHGSVRQVAYLTGLSERRITILIDGYAKSSKLRAKKLYAVDHISFAVVDDALLHYGEQWVLDDLYPLSTDVSDDTSADKSGLEAA